MVDVGEISVELRTRWVTRSVCSADASISPNSSVASLISEKASPTIAFISAMPSFSS